MAGAVQKDAMTVEGIFEDLKGRRAGLIKALTTDVREFYQQCDPEEEPLCLFGLPSGRWEVKPLANDGFPLLPDPALGINKARDTMQELNWLSLVALRSDGWLLAVGFFIGIKFGKANWRRLFLMIDALPTIYEIVTGEANKRAMEKSSVPYHSGNNSKFGSEAGSEPQGYCSKPMQARDGENHGLEEEEEGNEELTSGPAVISVLSGSMGSVSMSPNKNGV